MFCKKCGKELPEGTKFCPSCGTNQTAASSANIQDVAQSGINNLNQTINSFAEKNEDKLSDGEHEVIRAKWNMIPFAILWALYFLFMILSKTIERSYSYDFSTFNIIKTAIVEVILYFRPFFTTSVIIISILVCAISLWLFFVRRELVITNKKVYGRFGLIGTKKSIIPLNRIHYVAVRHTIIGRLLGSSSFLVYPGTIFGVAFRFVANAEDLKDAIEDELYKNQL